MTEMPDSRSQEKERRKTSRPPLEVPIELSVGSEMLIHATSNLSGQGAFFRRAIPYAEGTRAALRILLPGEQPIACQGLVVNIPNKKELGMGVKFEGLSREDQERINAFVAEHGKAEG
jgi:hypothetical protein